MKKLIVSILLFSNFALACPGGQHDECALWNPFANRCAQWICVPDVNIRLPEININGQIQNKADETASNGRSSGMISTNAGCQIFVVAALTTWGTEIGGPIGTAIGAGAGIGAAVVACNKIFGNE